MPVSLSPFCPPSLHPSGNNSTCGPLEVQKNEFHMVPADSLVLKIVINKYTKVWKMLIENFVGYSEDGKRKEEA